MERKRIAPALSLILLTAVGLYGCGGQKELTKITADNTLPLLQAPEPAGENGLSGNDTGDDNPAVTELTALADTREEAEEIANLYGIELSAYSYGVATYTTDKNLHELMELGLENDYPELTPNYEAKLHTEP